MKLVSIIIPYFRKKEFINKTIRSVINQTYKKFEILIIYDDTENQDFTFIKKLLSIDKRIKIIKNKSNLGAGLSRNKGIKKAKGQYIAFLDADDIWQSNKIKYQVNFMEKNNIDVSHTSYHIINFDGKIIGERFAKNLNYEDLIKSCDIGLSTVMIKKKILKNNLFPNLKTKEDYVLWLNLARKGYKFISINKKFTYWRSLKNSLSSSTLQKLIDGFRVYRYYLKKPLIASFFHLFVLSFNFLKK